MAASSSTIVYGQPVTFTATVTPQILGLRHADGTVNFVIDGEDDSVPLTAGPGDTGIASITLSTLTLGRRAVSATYISDSINFTGSSAPCSRRRPWAALAMARTS